MRLLSFSSAAANSAKWYVMVVLAINCCNSGVTATAQITPGITVGIKDVVQLPDTRTSTTEDGRVAPGFTRINFMKEVPDNSNRWFVNDLRGQIYVVDSATQTVLPNKYLDFSTSSQVDRFIIGSGGLSTGLVNITPDPNFANSGKFYTIHEETSNGAPIADFVAQGNAGTLTNAQHTVITEWTATDPTANVFSGSNRELLRIAQPRGNLHPAGDILFNPNDNLMYISVGDSGYDGSGKGDPQAQRLDSIFGKIIRIDPTGNNSANGMYGIPNDNPFVNGTSGELDEIYASGFRNPHRLSYDSISGNLFATDIGQSRVEEVNIIDSGENYGWGRTNYEGNYTTSGTELTSAPAGFTFPVAQYLHSDLPGANEAIAGGFVYRGSLVPELEGKFIFGDLINGQLLYSELTDILSADAAGGLSKALVYSLSLTSNGSAVTLEDLVIGARGLGESSTRVDMRLAQTLDGEIYIMSKYDGFVRQFVTTTAVPEPTGLGLSLLMACATVLKRRRR